MTESQVNIPESILPLIENMFQHTEYFKDLCILNMSLDDVESYERGIIALKVTQTLSQAIEALSDYLQDFCDGDKD